MTGKTHVGLGIAVLAGLCTKLSIKFDYEGILIVSLASLLPDIDHPKSIINKYLLVSKSKILRKLMSVFLAALIVYINLIYFHKDVLYILSFLLVSVPFSSHRQGITHSLCGLVLFALIISYIGVKYNISNLIYYFIIGYGMHIVCDMCTKRGVPLLYPLNNKKYKFYFNFSSNSKIGKIVEQFILIAGLVYIIYRLPVILM